MPHPFAVLSEGIAFSAVKNRPPYAIASVDAALLLATLLQQEGPMRITDAAERLGVSRSTAHRLLGMLVYRDFAEQLPDRRYGPGPLMRGGRLPQEPGARLRAPARGAAGAGGRAAGGAGRPPA